MTSSTPEQQPESDIPRESARTILFQFVVFPLGIVAIGVLVFFLFGLLASEKHTIREDLSDLRSGSSHRRWQAAYQLSKSLKRGEAKQYPDLAPEIAKLYTDARNDDPKIRRYLSMVLGNLGDPRATPVLVDGLRDSDPETRVYAVLALGEIRDLRALTPLMQMVGDREPDVRKSAVYALGLYGRPEAVPVIAGALGDETADVRWNAAIALARFGDHRAIPVLREMLDRRKLDQVAQIREDQKEEAMIAAISAYTALAGRDPALLQPIADADPNLRVRSAAKEALSR